MFELLHFIYTLFDTTHNINNNSFSPPTTKERRHSEEEAEEAIVAVASSNFLLTSISVRRGEDDFENRDSIGLISISRKRKKLFLVNALSHFRRFCPDAHTQH